MRAQLIDRLDELERFAALARVAPWLALDTEFVRDRTYFPRPGLIQIATPEQTALVDPVQLKSLAPLEALLFDSDALKILHAASQDLELFVVLFNRVPQPLFDTQKAAALLDLAPQIGYAALAETLLGAPPGAALGRYNWLKRPLAEQALEYAAEDVAHLGRMRDLLSARLETEGRTAEFAEAMLQNADAERYRPHPERAWKRIRAARKLDDTALSRLKPLAAWREEQAMREDRPRQWILRDNALAALARLAPQSDAELARTDLLRPAEHRRYGAKLIELLA
ncbi:MAG: ribonuclease D [Gammaproteobacteria bacterium]